MDKNRISIIIPVYNAEDYLSRCLDSILEQSFPSYEVILVDDGSSDSSGLICDRYSASDSRFRTIHKKNGGVSSARNAGINLAKGEYLMFVDSDDALLPDALDRLMEGVVGEDIVIGGYATFINQVPEKEVLPLRSHSYNSAEMTAFFDDNIKKNCEMLDAPWSKLFKRKRIGDLRFCEDLSYAEDKLFVFSFLLTCRSACTCDVPVYAYYIRSGSLGSDISSDRHLMQMRRFLPSYAEIINKLTNKYALSKKLSTLYRKDLIGRYCCRILNIFIRRKTSLLTKEYLSWLYSLMSADKKLGIFSIRLGQIFNLLLYKIGNPGFSIAVYRITSFFCRA